MFHEVNGEWKMMNGKWRMENGKWIMDNGELRSKSAKLIEDRPSQLRS
jgi:hypothetical protein